MSRSRLPIVIVMLVSLALAGVTRNLVIDQRAAAAARRGVTAGAGGSIAQLNSYALGLLLGGLRGPLVMLLWSSSETQKQDRDLADFDTKVEMIRLLQPEFDTVHLFQIWNKAFNISVLMANLPNKYTTILDALGYAFDVDAERPENVNIITAIAGIYFDKLGNSSEKDYYSPRLREETLPPQDRVRVTFDAKRRSEVLRLLRLEGAPSNDLAPVQVTGEKGKLATSVRQGVVEPIRSELGALGVTLEPRPLPPGGPVTTGGQRLRHDPLLGNDYLLLPQYTAPRGTHPGGGYDGSTLYFLKPFAPFPEGVSPFALGYNYYKRAQWLQENRGAHHAQIADRVISSRPALSIEKWLEEDWQRGRRAEAEAVGLGIPKAAADLESVAAGTFPRPGMKSPLFEEALHAYTRAAELSAVGGTEFRHHISVYPSDFQLYASHQQELELEGGMMAADRDYLLASQAAGGERDALLRAARQHYEQTRDGYIRHMLQYFITDEIGKDILPPGTTREADSLASLTPDQLQADLQNLLNRLKDPASYVSNGDDWLELDSYIERAKQRIAKIDTLLK